MTGGEAALREADARARALAQREFARPVWIEAGAGTGKTSVLVARILAWSLGPGWERGRARLVARAGASGPPPADERVAAEVLGRVVAITFTEAAAAEMAVRVGRGLAAVEAGAPPVGVDPDALPSDGPARRARARALLATLDQLVVRTIHAWCRRLLVAHALEAGVHPRFQVDADEHGLQQAAREEVEAHLQRAYGEPADEDALRLAALGSGPRELEATLLLLLREGIAPAELEADPLAPERVRAYLEGLAASCADFLEAGGAALVRCRRGPAVARAASRVERLLARLREIAGDAPEDLSRALEALRESWDDRNDWKRLGDWGRGRFGTGADDVAGCETPVAEAAAALRARLDHALALDPERLALSWRVLAPLLADAHERMRRAGVETYGALLRDVRDLLHRHPQAAARIRGGIDQLLVDEFQDTDAVQCEILRAIALEGEERPGLFLVGDPKQSIYGWRNADLRAYHGFVSTLPGHGGLCGELVVNHRSAPAVLAEVACAIEPVMVAEEGLQPPFQHLVPCERLQRDPGFTSAAHAAVEQWVSWPWDAEADAPDEDARAADATRLEARAVAHDLAALHHDHGVAWREIGLLFRSTGDLDVYLMALREAGVPYVVERDRTYYQRREVIEASALVRSLLDPHDQVALVTVLRSGVVGVPDAALLPLWRRRFPALFAQLRRPGDPRLAELRRVAAEAAAEVPAGVPGYERIRGWEAALDGFLPLVAWLRASFERECPDRFVERLRTALLLEAGEAARTLGAYRLANLDRFFRDLVGALTTGGADVSAVLASLRAAVSERREEEEGRPRDAAENAVQVMTVHKAKGLGFEHVYLLQCHKGSGRDPSQASRVARRGDRLSLCLMGQAALDFAEVASDAAAVERAEQVRTLYVALTRAKQRVVIAGRRGGRGAPPGYVGLLEKRSAGTPELAAWMRELHREGAHARDGHGARWVFPGLRPAPALAASSQAEAAVGDRALRQADRALARRRTEAGIRMRRPWSRAASGGHEAPAERLAAARYGEDADAEAAGAQAPGGVPTRADAMAAGTALHTLLERSDLAASLEQWQKDLEGGLDRWLAQDGTAAARERAAVVLERFLAGSLPGRLRALADHVVARELPVWLAPGAGPETPVGYVGGAIDLLYRDPATGEWVVADYKSDAVEPGAALRERARGYAAQGAVYTEAVQRALGLPERPRFELWFLAAGEVVREP